MGGPALYPVYSIVESELLLRRELEDYATLRAVELGAYVDRVDDTEFSQPLERYSDLSIVDLSLLVAMKRESHATNLVGLTHLLPLPSNSELLKSIKTITKVILYETHGNSELKSTQSNSEREEESPVSSVKYEKRKPLKKDPLWEISKVVRKFLDLGIKENLLMDISIKIRDRDGLVRELAELKKEFDDVPIWEKDLCLKMDIADVPRDNAWVFTISLAHITQCSPSVLVSEYKRLQEHVRKLLKEETWIKEIDDKEVEA